MPRIPPVRGLQSLQLAIAPSYAAARAPFAAARALSTTSAVQGKNTDWVRGKIWQGEAPGPEDPYTQRPEPEETSNLPDQALELKRKDDRTPSAVRRTRLVLPPSRTEAGTEADVQASDPSYVPATVVEGLEEIGTVNTWWDQPGHWGEESVFKGFGSVEKVQDKAVLEVYLRRAVVETLALQQSGALEDWVAKEWPAGQRAELDEALTVEVQVQDGKATLKGDVSAIATRLVSVADESGQVEKVSVEEAREIVKTWDASWKDLVLDDHLRFAIRKRLYQLTGQLIPDAKLGAARTVKHMLTLTAKPPKPKKLVELLQTRGELDALPNVTLHSRRVGPIDKEIAVGRWKVIEEELKKRNLPVTGTAGLSKNKERDWLSGRR